MPAATQAEAIAPDQLERWFNEIYQAYPRGHNRVAAFRAFQRLKPTAALVDEILEAILGYSQSEQWHRGKLYVPFLAKFLRRRQWLDCYPELTVGARGGVGSARQRRPR